MRHVEIMPGGDHGGCAVRHRPATKRPPRRAAHFGSGHQPFGLGFDRGGLFAGGMGGDCGGAATDGSSGDWDRCRGLWVVGKRLHRETKAAPRRAIEKASGFRYPRPDCRLPARAGRGVQPLRPSRAPPYDPTNGGARHGAAHPVASPDRGGRLPAHGGPAAA